MKGTRTIYPIQLSGIVASLAVTSHIIRYGTSSLGSFHPKDDDFAASISSGFDESIGSRIIDDMDLVHFSGNPHVFIIGLDYGEYDSHCTWKNFRQPIIAGLKKAFADDRTTFCGWTRNDLIEHAHGEGRMHGTLWDVGRRVVRANKKRVDMEIKRALGYKNIGDDTVSNDSGLGSGSDEVVNHRGVIRAPNGGIAGPPLRPATVGVVGVPFDVSDFEDAHGDILICSTEGHDFSLLESHGSGELTTLLFNSVSNLAIGDVIYEDRRMRNIFDIQYRRVVGDDRIEIARIKTDRGILSLENYEYGMRRMIEGSWDSGHVINWNKMLFFHGFCEYRQTHCLRGVYIPKDQIMLISSEKTKYVDDVQSLMSSFASLLRTKISRGFKIELAWRIFWFVVFSHTRISLKNYDLREGRIKLRPTNAEGWVQDRKRTFLVPNMYTYLLPLTMRGGSVDYDSFLLSNTESELPYWFSRFGEEREFMLAVWCSNVYEWYKIEAEERFVDEIMDITDPSFSNRLMSEQTRVIRGAVANDSIWVNFCRELVERAVKMEGRLLGRNIGGAEKRMVRMLNLLSIRRKEFIKLDSNLVE